jgi:RES domain-containing protein
VGWDALPASKTSIDWGTAWVRASSDLLVVVPSVVVPDEMNVLLNPLHPDAKKLVAVKVRKWLYDPRALGLPIA